MAPSRPNASPIQTRLTSWWQHTVRQGSPGTKAAAQPAAASSQTPRSPPAPHEPFDQVVRRHELVRDLKRTLALHPTGHLPAALACFDAARPTPAPEPTTPRHAILVLGIPVFDGDAPNPHFEARVRKAHALSELYPAAVMVVSGAHVERLAVPLAEGQTPDLSRVEAVAMQRQLVALGVHEKRILVEPNAQHTVGNLAYGYQKIEAELLPTWGGLDHLTVSMEPYHTPRATRIAQALLQTRSPATQLHVAIAARLPAKVQPLSRKEAALCRKKSLRRAGPSQPQPLCQRKTYPRLGLVTRGCS